MTAKQIAREIESHYQAIADLERQLTKRQAAKQPQPKVPARPAID
jgi:hypothetical protein